MLSEQLIIKEFEDAGAILKGHFILSSGLHSDTYLQCARALMNPQRASTLCSQLAMKVSAQLKAEIDIIVSPAVGGIIVGYELARHLKVDALFCEREEGKFKLRRGFEFDRGAKVLVVEDVITTGKSSLETFTCIHEAGGEVVGEAALIDRSGGGANLGVPLIALLNLNIRAYPESELPAELASIPAEKPGSRFLKR